MQRRQKLCGMAFGSIGETTIPLDELHQHERLRAVEDLGDRKIALLAQVAQHVRFALQVRGTLPVHLRDQRRAVFELYSVDLSDATAAHGPSTQEALAEVGFDAPRQQVGCRPALLVHHLGEFRPPAPGGIEYQLEPTPLYLACAAAVLPARRSGTQRSIALRRRLSSSSIPFRSPMMLLAYCSRAASSSVSGLQRSISAGAP